jgi:hypothetical protein
MVTGEYSPAAIAFATSSLAAAGIVNVALAAAYF